MLKASPFSDLKSNPAFESSVGELRTAGQLLTCEVSIDKGELIEVIFEKFWALRYMEEGDLGYYFNSDQFNDLFVIYEIYEGGWKSGECSGRDLMSLSAAWENYREWFILTRNFCLTVVCPSEPRITSRINTEQAASGNRL